MFGMGEFAEEEFLLDDIKNGPEDSLVEGTIAIKSKVKCQQEYPLLCIKRSSSSDNLPSGT